MRLLYLMAVYLATPLVSLMLVARGLRDRSYWRNFGQRFGLGPAAPFTIWVHAVSVGEVQAAAALVSALRGRYPELPVLVTTFTPTGAARARALFGGAAEVRFLPFDLPGSVRRFLDRTRPRLAVIMETELWPNLYRQCRRRRIPLIIASARLSRRSIDRYRRLGALFKETVSAGGVVVAAQGEGDAERFRALGAAAERTHVTGNLKFDLTLPPDISEHGRALREQYAPSRAVWVAGSTHGGVEEDAVLAAQRHVVATHAGTLLVLAPRHPNRFDEVAAWLGRQGIAFARRSQPLATAAAAGCNVLLLDTLGELLHFYAAADVAFVGGSLAPIGGHNLLEPAALGLPILTGPNNSNSEDVARLLLECGAARIVRNGDELGSRVAGLLSDQALRMEMGARGRATVERNRGSLQKLMALVASLL
jgi:3-deoxy-D-manno-octulosonic-acid transferase